MGKERPRGAGSARRAGSPYPKADFWPRFLAKLADVLVAGAFAYFVPHAGPVLALIFLLLADALPNGQSPGKRLLSVKVVHVPSRRPCNVRQSIVRNLPITVAAAFLMNPFLAFVAVPVILFELFMVQTDGLGIRIGDVFADTQVVDTKVPLAAVDPVRRLSRAARAALTPVEGETADVHPSAVRGSRA